MSSSENEDPSPKRYKRRSKDDSIYGIFGEDDEQDERPINRGQVNFVTANEESDSEPEIRMEMNHDEEEEEEIFNPGFTANQNFLPNFNTTASRLNNEESAINMPTPALNRDTSSTNRSSMRPLQNRNNARNKPVTVTQEKNKDFGKFLKMGNGSIISNMLSKMGWKEGTGLGKNKTGIVNPIEAKVRDKATGIGFNGRSEKSEQERKDERVKKRIEKEKEMKFEKQKEIEFINLDKTMLNIETKMINHVQLEPEVKAEIKKDIINIINHSKKQLVSNDQDMKLLNLQRTNFLKENEGIQEYFIKYQKDLELYIKLQDMCIQLEQQAIKIENDNDFNTLYLNLQSLEDMYESILKSNSDFKIQFIGFVRSIATALVTPIFSKAMLEFKPEDINEPFFNLFVNFNMLFKMEKQKVFEDQYDMDDSESISLSAFDNMLFNTWLPKIIDYIENQWDVHNSNELIIYLEKWQPIISTILFDHLIEDYIIKKMITIIEDTKCDINNRLDYWIHPWLLLIIDKIQPLLKSVKSYLAELIQEWNPTKNDHLLLECLLPWKKLYEEKSFFKLTNKHMLPKLESLFQKKFEIDPSEQSFEQIDCLALFQPVLSNESMNQLVNEIIFKKWFNVLHLWLDSDPPMMDLFRWYSFWKSDIFNKLSNESDLEPNLRLALVTILNYIIENP